MNQSIYSYQSQKTQRYFQQINGKTVKIYIRIVSRKSLKIQLPEQILLDELKLIIRKKFRISQDNQALYMKGVFLNYNPSVLLQNDWIIHVIDLSQVKLPQINFYIRPQSLQENKQEYQKCTMSSKKLLKDFISEFILNQFSVKLQQIMLIQSGRILKINLTFQQQNIQNGTTINLIHVKKDQKSLKYIPERSIKAAKSQEPRQFKSIQKSSVDNSFLKNQLKNNKKQLKSEAYNQYFNNQKNNQKCQIHQKNKKFRQSAHTIQNNPNDSSSTSIYSTRENITSPNRSIQIGQRQCNCRKQTHHVVDKSPKFISYQDKKKLQKQIRQQNLQKLMLKKHRQQLQEKQSPNTAQKKGLQKVRSLQTFKTGGFTQRKSIKSIRNPQKAIKA